MTTALCIYVNGFNNQTCVVLFCSVIYLYGFLLRSNLTNQIVCLAVAVT